MTTQVDELTSEVSVEPEPAPAPQAREVPEWEAELRLRAKLLRLAEERRRTAAEDFDD